MDLYSYINDYSQNKTSLEIPKLVFHQAYLVKYLSVVGQDWDPFHDYSLILFNKKALNECFLFLVKRFEPLDTDFPHLWIYKIAKSFTFL